VYGGFYVKKEDFYIIIFTIFGENIIIFTLIPEIMLLPEKLQMIIFASNAMSRQMPLFFDIFSSSMASADGRSMSP